MAALLLGLIFNGLFALISGWSDSQALGISIILFTFITRLLMTPLMFNQQRSSRRMTRLQPKIQKIQEKYKGKTDPESNQRMQAETQALYKENNASPMAGCLPLLIQMPIIFALFEVLRNVPFYVNDIGSYYREMAEMVMGVSGSGSYITESFETVIKGLKNFDVTTTDSVMDLLYHLNSTQWAELMEKLGLNANAAFQTAYQSVTHLNTFGAGFLTFNLTEAPGWTGWNLVIPVLAGITTFIQSFVTQKTNETRQKMASPDGIADQSQKSMKYMNYFFPVMTLFFAVSMPAGLGLYWIASNVFGLISQLIMDAVLDKQEYKEALKRRDELIAKREAAARDKSHLDKKTGGRLGSSNTQSKSALSGGSKLNKTTMPVKPVIDAEDSEIREVSAPVEAVVKEELQETEEETTTYQTAEVMQEDTVQNESVQDEALQEEVEKAVETQEDSE